MRDSSSRGLQAGSFRQAQREEFIVGTQLECIHTLHNGDEWRGDGDSRLNSSRRSSPLKYSEAPEEDQFMEFYACLLQEEHLTFVRFCGIFLNKKFEVTSVQEFSCFYCRA